MQLPVFYHETGYTCPFCGKAFKLTEFTSQEKEVHAAKTKPYLSCPSCKMAAFRTSDEERFSLQSFHRHRKEVLSLIEARFLEAEDAGY